LQKDIRRFNAFFLVFFHLHFGTLAFLFSIVGISNRNWKRIFMKPSPEGCPMKVLIDGEISRKTCRSFI
jgi:hypothetical protein